MRNGITDYRPVTIIGNIVSMMFVFCQNFAAKATRGGPDDPFWREIIFRRISTFPSIVFCFPRYHCGAAV
ncbi:hypothetical protein CFter6_1540 [Collimonas fungivorans]|uniref:Uncharacterized protein n=1 Tax=Collimonas fungivorans TaxID=158899 RepID=A0A127P9C9_9BURK|nr:hypothetical protein CFter6_1540 [Collimonas fungivorans]